MKTLIDSLLFIFMSSLLYGQDLKGEWSGSLQIQGTAVKVVLHVSYVDGEYTTTLDSPDQNANGIKVNTTTVDDLNVKFEIQAASAINEGVMSQNRITGKWLQSGTAFFLELSRNQLPDIQPNR
ncbi:MAG TPA: hypothetical protein VK589_27735 [Chryseolinea sp.]|nr:hypothetical protein [Chryseolinea sp.]